MPDNQKLPDYIVSALRSRDWADEEIDDMSPDKAFDEFCEWHGLIGWGLTLRGTLNHLRRADEQQSTDLLARSSY